MRILSLKFSATYLTSGFQIPIVVNLKLSCAALRLSGLTPLNREHGVTSLPGEGEGKARKKNRPIRELEMEITNW